MKKVQWTFDSEAENKKKVRWTFDSEAENMKKVQEQINGSRSHLVDSEAENKNIMSGARANILYSLKATSINSKKSMIISFLHEFS